VGNKSLNAELGQENGIKCLCKHQRPQHMYDSLKWLHGTADWMVNVLKYLSSISSEESRPAMLMVYRLRKL
jgi:hypothetical protein